MHNFLAGINAREKAAKAAYIKASVAYVLEEFAEAKDECEKANNYQHNNITLSNKIKELSGNIDKDISANSSYEEACKARKSGDLRTALDKVQESTDINPSNEYLREKIESLQQELRNKITHPVIIKPRKKPIAVNRHVLIAMSATLASVMAYFILSGAINRIIPSATIVVPPTATAPVERATALPGPGVATVPATPQETDMPTPTPRAILTPIPTPMPTPIPTPTQPLPSRNGIVITDGVRLRAGPGTNYQILSQRFLSIGTEVEILDGPSNEKVPATYTPKEPNARCNSRQWYHVHWYNVQQGSELKGWICADFLYIEGETAGLNR